MDETTSRTIKRILKRELKELKEIKRIYKQNKINVKSEAFARLHRDIMERQSAMSLLKRGKLLYVEVDKDRFMVGKVIGDETIEEAKERIKRLSTEQNNTNVGDESPTTIESLRENSDSPVPTEDWLAQDSSSDSSEVSREHDPVF